jgi:pyruvate dehydrogenase complex dehydrogenase (E1) component
MIDMTLDEVRKIREEMSLETAGMTADELHDYCSEGATKAEQYISEIRMRRGIVFIPANEQAVGK